MYFSTLAGPIRRTFFGLGRFRVQWPIARRRGGLNSPSRLSFALLCGSVNSVLQSGHVQASIKLSVWRVLASICFDELREVQCLRPSMSDTDPFIVTATEDNHGGVLTNSFSPGLEVIQDIIEI